MLLLDKAKNKRKKKLFHNKLKEQILMERLKGMEVLNLRLKRLMKN